MKKVGAIARKIAAHPGFETTLFDALNNAAENFGTAHEEILMAQRSMAFADVEGLGEYEAEWKTVLFRVSDARKELLEIKKEIEDLNKEEAVK